MQNLLANAVREAAAAGGEVRVDLADDVLRVTNPLAAGAAPPEGLWDEGVSGGGSTGLGLTIARDLAAKIGWRIRHETEGREVSFVVTPAPPGQERVRH